MEDTTAQRFQMQPTEEVSLVNNNDCVGSMQKLTATEISSKFAKPLIQMAGPKHIQHNSIQKQKARFTWLTSEAISIAM